jgi:hypothetical protein
VYNTTPEKNVSSGGDVYSGLLHLLFLKIYGTFFAGAKNPQPDKTRLSAIRKIKLSASCQHYVAAALIAFLRGALRGFGPLDQCPSNPLRYYPA